MKLHFFDYRYADAVLDSPAFKDAKTEIVEVFAHAPVPLLDPAKDGRAGGVKRRSRDKKRHRFFPVNQKAINKHLDAEFEKLAWQGQPPIVSKERTGGPKTNLKGDYKKGRLQVEVQFGNMARWYSDVFKFQLSYSLDEIDAAVLVVPVKAFANLIDENVAHFERVIRELPWAKMSLTLPIWTIGVEPDDYAPIQACYEEAADAYRKKREGAGETIEIVPFKAAQVAEPEKNDEETDDPDA